MKKRMLLSLIVVLAACCLCLAACSSGEPAPAEQPAAETPAAEQPAASTETYTISLSHPNNTNHPYHVGAETFKQLVEEYTNGNVTVEIYPSNQLGGPADTVQGIQLGTVNAGIAASSWYTSYDAALNALDLPYLFIDRETAFAKLDSGVGQELSAGLLDKNIKVLGFFDGGYRVMFNSKHAIESVADFANLQVRVMDSEVYINLMKAFGAMPISLAWEDVYTSIQQGVIDAAESGITQVNTNKFYEVAPYISITNHTYTTALLSMSNDLFESMPADYQQAILDAAEGAVAAERESIIAQDEESMKVLEEAGATISYPDLAELQAAAQPVWDAFAATYGQDVIDMMTE